MSREPESPFSEDQVLLQLDRELDQRMTNLLRPRPKSVWRRTPHTTTTTNTHRPGHHPAESYPNGHVFSVTNGRVEERDDGVMGSTGGHTYRVQGSHGACGGGGDNDGAQLRMGRGDGAEVIRVRNDGTHGRWEGGVEEQMEEAYDLKRDAEKREKEKREEEEQCSKESAYGKREEEEDEMLQSRERTETEGMKDSIRVKKENEGEEEEKEEDYAIFDEFLDASTRTRLRQMAGKVEALTQALHLAREECRQMASSKREASRAVQAAEGERRAMAKQTQGLKQESARLQKANTELKLRVKELGQECQALRKEASEARQREMNRGTGYTSLQAQLTRAKGECGSLREQLVNTRTAHKEEVEELRRKLSESEERRRELERERRDLTALTKKQERLIAVLHQQKNHIAAAKAVAGLEQKFLAAITPLHPS